MLRKFLIPFAAIASLNLTPALAQTTIERLAPEKSVVIVGAKNAQAIVDHFKSTGLWSLWQHEKIKGMRADAMKQMSEGLTRMFQELGVEEDSLVPPTGPTGLAVFPITDPDLGTPQVAFVALADYGDAANADKTHALVQAALTRGEQDGQIEYEENDVNGRTVFSVDLSQLDKKEPGDGDDLDDEGMDFEPPPFPMPDTGEMMKGLKKLHYVREGNAFLIASDLAALTESFEAADGRGLRNGGLTDRADFQALMEKIGESDMYGMVLTRDIMELTGAVDPMGMAMMMRPMLRSLVGEVQGYGIGIRIDSPAAMIEQRFAISMPNGKQGLTTLIDNPSPAAPLPPFVGPETVSYSSLNFDFAGMMEVIRKVINSNPILQANAGQQLPQIEQTLGPLLGGLGSRIHTANSVTKPFTATSNKAVFAIECTRPQEFENAFGAIVGPMGMEPRDFLGQRIYSLDPNMMSMMMPGLPAVELSIGIGGGYVVIGPTPAVEQSLRSTGQAAPANLSASANFQRATAALPKLDAIAWGFSDTVDSMEAAVQQQRLVQQKMLDELRQENPEWADQMQADLTDQSAMFDKIDFNLLREYIGPSVWQLRSTDDGFEGVYYLLSAQKDQ